MFPFRFGKDVLSFLSYPISYNFFNRKLKSNTCPVVLQRLFLVCRQVPGWSFCAGLLRSSCTWIKPLLVVSYSLKCFVYLNGYLNCLEVWWSLFFQLGFPLSHGCWFEIWNIHFFVICSSLNSQGWLKSSVSGNCQFKLLMKIELNFTSNGFSGNFLDLLFTKSLRFFYLITSMKVPNPSTQILTGSVYTSQSFPYLCYC